MVASIPCPQRNSSVEVLFKDELKDKTRQQGNKNAVGNGVGLELLA